MSYQDDGGNVETMTLRDYFAAKAVQGMLAAPVGKFPGQNNAAVCVRDAFVIADEILDARKK